MVWDAHAAEIRLMVHTFTFLHCFWLPAPSSKGTYLKTYKFSITNNLYIGDVCIEADNFFISAENSQWFFVLFLSKTL